MIEHTHISKASLQQQIKNRQIILGGNKRLKIYGMLSCKSGKRMKRANRVFFASEQDAIGLGYRPCGHCMKAKYEQWKMSASRK